MHVCDCGLNYFLADLSQQNLHYYRNWKPIDMRKFGYDVSIQTYREGLI